MKSLNNFYTTNNLVEETQIIIEELMEKVQIEIKWIKGHDNNTGNEFADMLAREGVEQAEELAFAAPYYPMSQREMKQLIHKSTLEQWQVMWNNMTTCE